MTTCDFTKNDSPKFIFCSKKGTPKMAHPVPAYMVVTPPPGVSNFFSGKSQKNKLQLNEVSCGYISRMCMLSMIVMNIDQKFE